jgi:hypothetical protein
MELQPHHQQGEEQAQLPEQEISPEVRRISEGIAEALRDGSTIDHETAWLIAKNITPGSGALHELSRTGEISPDIGADFEVAYEVLPDVVDTWIAALPKRRKRTSARMARTTRPIKHDQVREDEP